MTLGGVALKRLSKTVDAAFANIHAAVNDVIKPCIEQLLFYAAELQGHACWHERLLCVGLNATNTQRVVAESEQLLTASTVVQVECRAVACMFRSFFLWLQRCQRRYEPHCVLYACCARPASVCNAVCFPGRLNDDGSAVADVSRLPTADMSLVSSLLSKGMSMKSLALHFAPPPPSADSGTVVDCFARLEACCRECFEHPPKALSSSFTASGRVIPLVADSGTVSRLAFAGMSEYGCFACSSLVNGSELPCVGVTRRSCCGDSLQAMLLRLAEGEQAIDLQFYRAAVLLVLVREKDGACRIDSLDCAKLHLAEIDGSTTVAAGAVYDLCLVSQLKTETAFARAQIACARVRWSPCATL